MYFEPSKLIRDRKIKIAVLGCGRISTNHFKAIKDHSENLELVAVCDNNPERLAEAEKEHKASGYLDYDELLENSNADAISICTPSGLHADQTIRAAKHGKHVICEKPMATRWSDAKRMVSACDEAKVGLFIVKQNRENATIRLLKEAIDKKRFGKIYMININVFWSRPQEYYDQAQWRGTWEFDGGAFMNQASHYIDLLDYLIGPVESVFSYTGTLGRNIEVEDTGTIALKWRSGTLGSVNVTMLTYPKNFEGSITLIGEKGTVRLGGLAVNEIQHWEFADSDPMDEKVSNATYETTSVYGYGHPLYYQNIIDSLRGQGVPKTDGREGLKSLEVLVAAYMSARDGRKVSIPLDY